jgi:hypothetical protein
VAGPTGETEPVSQRPLSREEIDQLAHRSFDAARLARREAEIHQIAADTWGTLNYTLGLPIVVLSAIASTSALADFDKSNVVAGVVALIVAILSALATFLNAQKASELHRAANASYRTLELRAVNLGRDIDTGSPRSDPLDLIHKLEDELTKLIHESPSYSRRLRTRYERTSPEG